MQEFFERTFNSTYKLKEDAVDFYETINNLKINGFKETISYV